MKIKISLIRNGRFTSLLKQTSLPKTSLEMDAEMYARYLKQKRATQTEQLVTKSQNTQTSLESTSKSTQVSPSVQSESTQTAENQWSEIFAVQGENAKLKYQLLFNICNTLTEKLERQAEKISKLESEVQTLRTAQTHN